jgi:Xaa-Pro aminopeptidase
MRKRWVFFIIFIMVGLAVLSASNLLLGDDFPKSEYAARRARFMEQIPASVAVIRGAAPPGGDRKFYQNTDFIYFTGVEIPDAILIMDGIHKQSILFFTISEKKADGEGISLDLVRRPKEVTGIEKFYPVETFPPYMTYLSLKAKAFYTPFRPQELSRENSNEKFRALQKSMTFDIWDGRLTRELRFVKQLREKFPQVAIRDCSKIIWDLRKIKSPAEIAVLRKAGEIGVEGHIALMQSTRPGIGEHELAAVFSFVCAKEGARDLGYETILMSGKNHAYGHYHEFDRVLEDGDFIILDAGPDFRYYHVDISSSFPANGRYSEEQKKLYELGMAIRKVCLDNYRPGVTFRQIGDKVKQYLVKAGVDPNAREYKGLIRYGGYNHSIGMATHDPMGTFAGPDEVLKPGFVFACDINIPYPEKKLGLRIEDTIVITATGYENLSKGLPRTIAAIEALMKTDGIIQVLKKGNRY